MRLSLLVGLFVALLVAVGPSVRAQDTQEDIYSVTPQTEEITRLRTQLRGQVEDYRTTEREFAVAKQQHEQLQTLVSLEEAVGATREVMLIRADVLVTYLEILQNTLEETGGIPLAQKETQQSSIKTAIADLKIHRETVDDSRSREAVVQRSADFAPLIARVITVSEQTRVLVAIGRIQTIHAQSERLFADIKIEQETEEINALRESERERAYKETEKYLEETTLIFDELKTDYRDGAPKARDGFYADMASEMSPIYARLNKGLSFIEELLRI